MQVLYFLVGLIPFYCKMTFLSLLAVFVLKSFLSDISIAIPVLFWFPFVCNIIFHHLTFSLCASLYLVSLLYVAYIWMGLVFFNPFRYSMSFNWGISLFKFKVFVDMYVLNAILMFCSSCVSLSYSSFVIWWFYLVLRLFSLFILCIFYRFLFCGYHEAYRKHIYNSLFKLITIEPWMHTKTLDFYFPPAFYVCFWCQNLYLLPYISIKKLL